MIAQVSGRLAAKRADRVVIQTSGGVGYEIVVPLGVMERLPAVGEGVSLATELVIRDDGWSLYGFDDEAGRRLFQRLIGVTGVGPKIAIALLSALGVERGARAVQERNIALLASVPGIGKKTAERLALELADKLGEFDEAGAKGAGVPSGEGGGGAAAALLALERLGYATGEADRALRQVLAADGGGPGAGTGGGAPDTETLVRRALQLLTHG
ncbi:MAG TPA: Holliday junction branch migration protein RuvA [Gemmatimonadales bacterium]|nr:Holliday junction branch migration protein RuvA [Gemmatimonadales bacterium]